MSIGLVFDSGKFVTFDVERERKIGCLLLSFYCLFPHHQDNMQDIRREDFMTGRRKESKQANKNAF